MRYYIADLHFFHENLNHMMDMRGFENAAEMNNYMISQWNSRVRSNDEVIIIGDLSFGNGKDTNEILKMLNGTKYLIQGNHDRIYLEDKRFDTSAFKWIKQYEELKDNKRKVILSHYPIMCYNGQYNIDLTTGNGISYMLYGHVHNTHDEKLIDNYIRNVDGTEIITNGPKGERKTKIRCQMINCFCMYSDYIPLTLDEWIDLDKKRRAEMRKN